MPLAFNLTAFLQAQALFWRLFWEVLKFLEGEWPIRRPGIAGNGIPIRCLISNLRILLHPKEAEYLLQYHSKDFI